MGEEYLELKKICSWFINLSYSGIAKRYERNKEKTNKKQLLLALHLTWSEIFNNFCWRLVVNVVLALLISNVTMFQLGIASGFLIPPLLVNSKGTSDEIQHDLFILFLGVAIFTTVLFVAIILCKYTLLFSWCSIRVCSMCLIS